MGFDSESDISYGDDQFDSFDEDLDQTRHGHKRSSRHSNSGGSRSNSFVASAVSPKSSSAINIPKPFSPSNSVPQKSELSFPPENVQNPMFRATRNLDVDLSRFEKNDDELAPALGLPGSTIFPQEENMALGANSNVFQTVDADAHPHFKVDAATSMTKPISMQRRKPHAPVSPQGVSRLPQAKNRRSKMVKRESISPGYSNNIDDMNSGARNFVKRESISVTSDRTSPSAPRNSRKAPVPKASNQSMVRPQKRMIAVPSHKTPAKLIKHTNIFLKKASRVLSETAHPDEDLRFLVSQVSDLLKRAPVSKPAKGSSNYHSNHVSRSVPPGRRNNARRFDEGVAPIGKLVELDKELAFLANKYNKATDDDLVDVLSKKCKILEKEIDTMNKTNRKLASENYRRDRNLAKSNSKSSNNPCGDLNLEKQKGELRRVKNKHEAMQEAIETHQSHLEEMDARHASLSLKVNDVSEKLSAAVKELPAAKEESPFDYADYELEDKMGRLKQTIEKITQHRQRLSRRYHLVKAKIAEEVSKFDEEKGIGQKNLDLVLSQFSSIKSQIARLESLSHSVGLTTTSLASVSVKNTSNVGGILAMAESDDGGVTEKVVQIVNESIPVTEEPASVLIAESLERIEQDSLEPKSSRLDDFIGGGTHRSLESDTHSLHRAENEMKSSAADDGKMRLMIDELRKRRGEPERQSEVTSDHYSSCHEEYNSPMPNTTEPIARNHEIASVLDEEPNAIRPSISLAMAAATSISNPITSQANDSTNKVQQPKTMAPMLPPLAGTPKPAHAPISVTPIVFPPSSNSIEQSVQQPTMLSNLIEGSSDFQLPKPITTTTTMSAAPLTISLAKNDGDLPRSRLMNNVGNSNVVDLPGLGDSFKNGSDDGSFNKSDFFNKHGLTSVKSPVHTLGTHDFQSDVGGIGSFRAEPEPNDANSNIFNSKPRKRRARAGEQEAKESKWDADFLKDI